LVSEELKKKGYIMLNEGYNKNVLKLKPPLVFNV